jgi:hypothetical protein
MPVQVNPLILQQLVYDILDDLEFAQDSIYNDELSIQVKYENKKKRMEYESRLRKLLVNSEHS